jgi:hypothetical protein
VPGVAVTATYSTAYVGTPTYGSEPLGTFLNVRVEVDDARVRETRPDFDGRERPFAFVTVRHEGRDRTLRVDLAYKYTAPGGYYGERAVDTYVLEGFRVDELVPERGLAVGFDTNLGTIWAQDPDQNFPITKN